MNESLECSFFRVIKLKINNKPVARYRKGKARPKLPSMENFTFSELSKRQGADANAWLAYALTILVLLAWLHSADSTE